MGDCCATGRVIVSFIVETDGSITDVVKLRDIGCRIADRVVNAVSIMPKWIPGKLNDKAVRVRYVLAYSFFIR
jgi:protein TonB